MNHQSVNTSAGPAAAQAISAENLSETEKAALAAVNTHNGGAEAETPPSAEGGELIAGKFKTQEDLVKAYEQLQSEYTKNRQSPEEAAAETPTIEEAAEAATGDPSAFDAYSQEFAENGSLSDETYAALEKQGISRDMVNTYIRGQEAAASEYQSTVFEAAGGAEQYTAITQWAAKNMTAAEIKAFNDAVDSGDAQRAALAATGLKAKYEAKNGRAPTLITGDATGASTNDVFENYAQVTAVMRTPEYKTDPAFRRKVDAKIARSPNL